jgi:hypothetical protein
MLIDEQKKRILLLETESRQKQEQFQAFASSIKDSHEGIAVLDKNMCYLCRNFVE